MPLKKIGASRYINTEKILTANVFQKDTKFKVCFELDTEAKEPKTAFSDELADLAQAEALILSMSNT